MLDIRPQQQHGDAMALTKLLYPVIRIEKVFNPSFFDIDISDLRVRMDLVVFGQYHHKKLGAFLNNFIPHQ